MPTPAGGTIADGTYYLTGWDIYPPGTVDAYMRKETWVIASGTLQAVSQRDSDPESRNAGTFTTAGTTITLSVSCPVTASLDTYTATEVHTYTKQ